MKITPPGGQPCPTNLAASGYPSQRRHRIRSRLFGKLVPRFKDGRGKGESAASLMKTILRVNASDGFPFPFLSLYTGEKNAELAYD